MKLKEIVLAAALAVGATGCVKEKYYIETPINDQGDVMSLEAKEYHNGSGYMEFCIENEEYKNMLTTLNYHVDNPSAVITSAKFSSDGECFEVKWKKGEQK